MTTVVYKKDFDKWLKNMTPKERRNLKQRIRREIKKLKEAGENVIDVEELG